MNLTDMANRDFTDEEIVGFLNFLLESGKDQECSNTFRMIDQLKRERDYWIAVSDYLGACHAATAEYEGELSSTSKSRKRRYALICETAAKALRGQWHPDRPTNIERTTDRCGMAAATLKENAS